MPVLAQTLRNGLIWVALLVVLPGILYAVAMTPDGDAAVMAGNAQHSPNCGVCRLYHGASLPDQIDENNTFVLSNGQLRHHSIN
jgi:hypothetical protein